MRAVTQHYDDALRPVGLRITQFSVLGGLLEGDARVRDLAEKLAVDDTTLTRSLRTMESNGWIRTRPGEDRRERIVSITADGKALLTKAEPLWRHAQESIAAKISTTTWDTLFRALPKVAEAAG